MPMPLLVDQLIYTNLSKTGFQLLTSPKVPLEVQDGFIHQVVYQLWDAYNPPPPDQRKIFLRQITPTQTLFGWLYIDGRDELGRSSIPYFLGYYLAGELQLGQLEEIINYLAKGPIYFIERERLPQLTLDRAILPLSDHYKSARAGVKITDEEIARLAARLTGHKLLQFQATAAVESVEMIEVSTNVESDGDPYGSRTPNDGAVVTQQSLNLEKVEQLLLSILEMNPSIAGLLLLGQDGSPLTPLLTQGSGLGADLEEGPAIGLAQNLLAIARSSQQLLNLDGFLHGEIHLKNGHWVVSHCETDCYLVTIAEKMLTGLLEIEIKRILKQIKGTMGGESVELNRFHNRRSASIAPFAASAHSSSNGGAIESDILYRGRRLSS